MNSLAILSAISKADLWSDPEQKQQKQPRRCGSDDLFAIGNLGWKPKCQCQRQRTAQSTPE
jgi:hypothetical protein